MALHLIPLLIGAAAGAAVTYVFADQPTREKLKLGVTKAGEDVKSGLARAKTALSHEKSKVTHVPVAE